MSNEISVECSHPECDCKVTAADDSGVAYCSEECRKANEQEEGGSEDCPCAHSPCDS